MPFCLKVMLGMLDSTGSEHLGSIQNFLLRTQPCIVNNTSNQIASQSFVHFFCLVVVYCVLQVNILKTYAVLYYEHLGVKDKFNCSTVSL